jgi:hypothetical protein
MVNIKARYLAVFVLLITVSHILISCKLPESKGKDQISLSKMIKQQTIQAMAEKFGDSAAERIEIGVQQVADRWKAADGTEQEFQAFCSENFSTDQTELDAIFERFQKNLESLYGNLNRISRDFKWALDVDCGKVFPIDYLWANYSPSAHTSDDLFNTKLAFVALLNFPIENLEQKNSQGVDWSRRKWAEVRLVEEFMTRVPAEVSQKRSETYTMADDYINNYNIFMNHLLDENGNRLFPPGLKLISHWGLRDELKAQYALTDGLERQRIIQKVMERIVLQEIPAVTINSDTYDWNPYSNKVFEANSQNEVNAQSEANQRYQHIWNIYQVERLVDPYHPHAPTLIDRKFQINREMSESEVENLLKSVTSAPVLKEIAKMIEQRLGRPLEPFDIWYNGFKPRARYTEEELDTKVRKLYPTVSDFQKDLPYILRKIGFSPDKSETLASFIAVDPSRGAGHAMGAATREDKAHLRTRIPEDGMRYKGFNIAIHELGHNVEQVFSLNGIDYYTLNGVPNTAFTEAFAFVFQSRDLQVLGLEIKDQEAEDLEALNTFWMTYEISGVALTDMYIWRWMYQHPDANAVELRTAMIEIAKKVWNDYYAPILGMKDQILLAIYSHIVDGAMYTPDYPLGHIISFQIEEFLKSHSLAPEMERMCKLGRLSPQIWMQQAVGQKVSTKPLIEAAEKAVKNIKQ